MTTTVPGDSAVTGRVSNRRAVIVADLVAAAAAGTGGGWARLGVSRAGRRWGSASGSGGCIVAAEPRCVSRRVAHNTHIIDASGKLGGLVIY